MLVSSPMPATVVCNREATPFLEAAGQIATGSFALGPHHTFVDSQRYLCFVPLITTYALLPSVRVIDSNFHVLDLIPEHVVKSAAAGRCHLVFDAGTEGDMLIEDAFNHLHAWLDEKGIQRTDVTYINQNRRLGELYSSRYGAGIRFECFDYYVKRLLSVMTNDDEAFEAATGASRTQLPEPGLQEAPYSFLCMNGAPRTNRIVLVSALLSKGLLADSYWSMLGAASNKLDTVSHDAKGYRDMIGADWIDDAAIDSVIAQTPRIFPDEAARIVGMSSSNDLANSINPNSFRSGAISIVTETEFTGGEVLRITEKAVKPYCIGHPAVIAGNPKALTLIRELGFQTFSPLIDERYDDAYSPSARLDALMEAVNAMRSARNEDVRGAINEICRFNAAFARNQAAGAYESQVERSLVVSLASRLARYP